MSLDKIERHLNDLEALREYPSVKKERDELKASLEEAKLELKSKEDNNVALNKEATVLETALAEKESKFNEQTAQLQTRGGELSKANARIRELENLKSLADGKTLMEAEKMFLVAKQVEIDKRAIELAEKKHVEWERTGKPKEVAEEAIRKLNLTIDGLQTTEQGFYPVNKVDYDLTVKVEQTIQEEVNQNLDDEFNRRVEAKSERIAQEKIKQLVNTEWPKYVEPRVIEMDSKMRANALACIMGPWTIPCDRCMTNVSVKLGPEGTAKLLKNEFIDVICDNPNCPGKPLIGKHKRRVQLSDFIRWRIGAP